ncbi:MAG: hypothetical protein Kow0058_07970 [Roseovarius sp.]
MGLSRQHELHRRRFSRNVGLGVVLGAFAVLIFGLTVAKVSRGDYAAPPPAAVVAPAGGQ